VAESAAAQGGGHYPASIPRCGRRRAACLISAGNLPQDKTPGGRAAIIAV